MLNTRKSSVDLALVPGASLWPVDGARTTTSEDRGARCVAHGRQAYLVCCRMQEVVAAEVKQESGRCLSCPWLAFLRVAKKRTKYVLVSSITQMFLKIPERRHGHDCTALQTTYTSAIAVPCVLRAK